MLCKTKEALALIIALGLLGAAAAIPVTIDLPPPTSTPASTPAPKPTPAPCGPIDAPGSSISVVPGSQGSLIKVTFRAANAGDQAPNTETLRGVLEPLDLNGEAVTAIGIDEACGHEPPAAGAPSCGAYTCSRGIPASMIPAALNATSQAFTFRVRATLSECIGVAGPDGAPAVECFGVKLARYAVRVERGVGGALRVRVEDADEVALDTALRPRQEAGGAPLRVGERAAVTLGVEQDGFAVLPGRARVWAAWRAMDDSASTVPAAMAAYGEGYRMGATMRASDGGMDTVVEFTASPPAARDGVLEVPLPATLVLLWEAEAEAVVPGQAAPAAAGGGEGGARRQGGAGGGRRVAGRREMYVAGEAGGDSPPPAAPSGGDGDDSGGRVVARAGRGGEGPGVTAWLVLAAAAALLLAALCALRRLAGAAARGGAGGRAAPASSTMVLQSSLFLAARAAAPRPAAMEPAAPAGAPARARDNIYEARMPTAPPYPPAEWAPPPAAPGGAPPRVRDCRLYPLEGLGGGGGGGGFVDGEARRPIVPLYPSVAAAAPPAAAVQVELEVVSGMA